MLVGDTGVFVKVNVGKAVAVKVGVAAAGVLVAVLMEVGVAVTELDRRLNASNKSMRPYPYVLSAPTVPRSAAELISAFSCSAAVRFGRAESRSASPPATCGAASDVPVGL